MYITACGCSVLLLLLLLCRWGYFSTYSTKSFCSLRSTLAVGRRGVSMLAGAVQTQVQMGSDRGGIRVRGGSRVQICVRVDQWNIPKHDYLTNENGHLRMCGKLYWCRFRKYRFRNCVSGLETLLYVRNYARSSGSMHIEYKLYIYIYWKTPVRWETYSILILANCVRVMLGLRVLCTGCAGFIVV